MCDEISTLLIPNVLRRTVGQHLQWSLESGVHSHLVDTGALTHGMVVISEETVFHGISHSTRRIVHGTSEHAQIGRCDVVAGLIVQRSVTGTGFPLGILQTFHAFEVKDVGIGTLDAERLQTVIVEIEMMLGGTGSYLVS